MAAAAWKKRKGKRRRGWHLHFFSLSLLSSPSLLLLWEMQGGPNVALLSAFAPRACARSNAEDVLVIIGPDDTLNIQSFTRKKLPNSNTDLSLDITESVSNCCSCSLFLKSCSYNTTFSWSLSSRRRGVAWQRTRKKRRRRRRRRQRWRRRKRRRKDHHSTRPTHVFRPGEKRNESKKTKQLRFPYFLILFNSFSNILCSYFRICAQHYWSHNYVPQ